MSKFIMKIVCYFKKHFVTRIRNFVFTYRKSIERKCPVTITITIITITNHGPKSIILRKQLRQTTIVIVQSKLVIVDPLVPENFPL